MSSLVEALVSLTPEQESFRKLVRDFAEQEVAPIARSCDLAEEVPRSLLGRMADLGFFGGVVPPEWGGLGLDHVTYAVLIEEMARVDHIVAVLMSMPSGLVGAGLRKFGTPQQKERWLRPLAQGRIFGAGAVTEPGSGTDVAGLTTGYRRDGAAFVIDGTKAWISNLDLADFIVTFATRDRSAGRRGISAFVIPRDTPGLVFRPYREKLGFRSITTGEVLLDGVRVPDDCLLGEEGEGFAVAMAAVENGRLAVAARAVGVAQSCLDDSVAYARDRQVFGQPIAHYQLIQAKVADMAVGVSTARLLVHAAAGLMDRGERARVELSMAKLHASDVLQRAATEAVQIHGAYGTSGENRVARFYRDAKVFQLVEGTNEIHRLLVGEYLLGIRS
jgi:alkylation response protein AidB-like acyl-CoA dehydrogenase